MNLKNKLLLGTVSLLTTVLLGTSAQAVNFTSRRLNFANLKANTTVTTGESSSVSQSLTSQEQGWWDTIARGGSISIGVWNVENSPNLFCIDSSNRMPTIEVTYSKNGEPTQYSKNEIAYILSKTRQAETGVALDDQVVQGALWRTGLNIAVLSDDAKARGIGEELYNEALAYAAYAQNYEKQKEPSIVDANENTDENNIVGPFVINYASPTYSNNVMFGQITKATLKDQNGNVVDSSKWSITDKNGNKLSNTIGTNTYEFPNPKQEFYIKIDPSASVTKASLSFDFNNVEATANVLKLRGSYHRPAGSGTPICEQHTNALNAAIENCGDTALGKKWVGYRYVGSEKKDVGNTRGHTYGTVVVQSTGEVLSEGRGICDRKVFIGLTETGTPIYVYCGQSYSFVDIDGVFQEGTAFCGQSISRTVYYVEECTHKDGSSCEICQSVWDAIKNCGKTAGEYTDKTGVSHPSGLCGVTWSYGDEPYHDSQALAIGYGEIKTTPITFTIEFDVAEPVGLDLSLRKFITAVEGIALTNSREPIPNLSGLRAETETTAIYNHPKNLVGARVGDLVTYTIRVYNEGKVDGYAMQITDHLPENLEFVASDPTNIAYGWRVSADGRTVTTSYLQNTKLTKYNNGNSLDSADVQIVAKVKDQAEKDEILVNIAEISKYAFDDNGTKKEISTDRDSTQNDVVLPSDSELPNYYGNGIVGNYVKGQEDDDDFERVTVTEKQKPKDGEYEVKLLKVDQDTYLRLPGAYFSVSMPGETSKNVGPTNSSGLISLGSVEITEEGTDTITIREIHAPDGYEALIGSITLTITKTLSDDKYIVSDASISDRTHAVVSLDDNLITVIIENKKETPPPEVSKNSIEVTKTWNDYGDYYNTRPYSITVNLMANGEKVDTATLNNENGWKHVFEDLDEKDADDNEIKYTIEEVYVTGYTSSITATTSGFNIENTLRTVDISATKNWDDENNKYSLRPDTITISLYANGRRMDSKTISAKRNETATFEDLPMYMNGRLVNYTVAEDSVPKAYNANVTGSDYSFVIKNKLETIDIPITKEWIDNSNRLGRRPSSITVIAKGNGVSIQKSVEIRGNGNTWTGTITGLPKYTKDGTEISYQIEEVDVNKYVKSQTGDYKSGTKFTNTALIDIGGVVWLDEMIGKQQGRDGVLTEQDTRFAGIKVELLDGNGNVIETKVTDANGSYLFEDKLITGTYQIRFEYKGQQYIPVNVTRLNSGSYTRQNSAGEETAADRNALNDKFYEIVNPNSESNKGIARNRNGQNTMNLSYSRDESKHTSTLIRDDAFNNATLIKASTQTFSGAADYVEYINLGLIERAQVNLGLMTDVDNVQLTINGKTETYDYSQRDEATAINLSAKAADLTRVYNQALYKSDYNFRISDYNDEKTVEISEANELQAYITYKVKISNYSSKPAKVSELKMYYDSTYNLVDSWYSKTAKGNNGIISWVAGDASYGYKTMTTSSARNVELNPNESLYVYVRFQVSKDDNGNIRTGEKYIISEITGYATDEGLIDTNSNPNNISIRDWNEYVRTFEDDTDRAPGLNLYVDESLIRTMTGFVFEDTVAGQDADGVYIGDGIRQDGELLQNGVIVQLIERVELDGTIYEYIWQETVTGSDQVSYMDRSGKLHENGRAKVVEGIGTGEYKFTEYIPGNYIVRFIYGEKIVDGKVILSGQDYKATTYAGYGDDTSSAKDNSVRRIEVMNYSIDQDAKLIAILNNTGVEPEELAENTWMNADTVKTMEIGVNAENPGHKVNFGVIKRPESSLKIHKEVAGVKVTNKGQTLIDTENGITAGYNAVKKTIELDDELINGANLEVKYNIWVENTSDNDTLYNYFGDDTIDGYELTEDRHAYIKSGATIVQDFPTGLGFDPEVNPNYWTMSELVQETQNGVSAATGIMMEATDESGLYEAKEPGGETVKATITLSKVLSISGTDDIECLNEAKIVEFRNLVGRKVGGDPTDDAEVFITEPTGKPQTYYALTASAILIFVIGIILIKRRVLDKKV